MGRKKIKHLGRYKKMKRNIKKIISVVCVIISICVILNITNHIKNTNEVKEIHIEESKTDFINKVEKGAKKSYREYEIFPSITIAQAILESGWVESE